ncbi:MAG: hypothetical protein A2171_01445 [Candidatus Levybacteria bacterium RBG_13_35_9]|nr:MAG: hypothetical protein A2171_01445 [Candidatus Levybacteria bacterium RBG_13_35_9]
MSNQERCLQTRIGTCTGCPIQGIVLEKRRAIPRSEEYVLIDKVQGSLCPDGIKMHVPQRPEPPLM